MSSPLSSGMPLSSEMQLREMMTSGPCTTAALCAFVERINGLARQIELEGLPASMDWPILSSANHRAAVLRVLSYRMAMRSAAGYLN